MASRKEEKKRERERGLLAALERAMRKLRESQTPLSRFIDEKFGGIGLRPLGSGPGALTEDFVRAIQKTPGRHGFIDVTLFEPPRPARDKFSKMASLKFKGSYPEELMADTPEPPPDKKKRP
ncbi:MAG: hypothetical protein JXR83_05440 [Deltaproteobacteria bacterium]|nr:hypothetical protein [Deltaproteobacteria bacterium]